MKNQNRKRVLPLDYIRQKQNEQSKSKQSKQKGPKSSGSSDFSQFQLQLKDNNKVFKPFKKPKFWKNQSDVSKSVQKLQPKNKQETKTRKTKKRKEKHQKHQHHKKQLNQNQQIKKKADKNYQIVSFKMNQPNQPNLFIKLPPKQDTKRSKNQQQAQQLIVQYDKKDFANTSPQRRALNHEKQGIKQRSKQKSPAKHPREVENEQNQVLKQTSGGICFDVTVTDFVRNQESPKKDKKRKAKRSLVAVDPNSKEQILRRRQIAFRYGQFARRRTFGYY